ncbi:N-acetylgalactosamine kinase isoform X1 [Anabrus simplex]|uniref:N-acetylgalactosamine kinase isoform X1 n=2 Tax=Anabrus simplex TaxID=316456 RepID=UPI0035A340A7
MQVENDSPPVLEITKNDDEYARVVDLRTFFMQKYGKEPTYYVRVPGRVNLIGEHIDYCGYSVCPMAIQYSILIAARETDNPKSAIVLSNTDPKHEDFECDIHNFSIVVEQGKPPGWHNYFLCGVKGILETMSQQSQNQAVGITCAVSGNIPVAAGLSSSSALVCAAALAVAHVNKVSLSKLEYATLCAKAEYHIGTLGGGMDQAIAFLASKGSAKHISFNPLQVEDIKLPVGATFVVSHSLAKLNKAETSDFNQRVSECRLATQVIAKAKGLDWTKFTVLASLQAALGASLDEMVDMVLNILHEEPYKKSEICSLLEVDEMQLNEKSLAKNVINAKEFKLQQRALHVFQEAKRVMMFCQTCEKEEDSHSAIKMLGELMKKSHISLQKLYECSHPNLDRLVALGEGLVAGTRLTGAGWGGCTVTLTTKENAAKYITLLKEKFYSQQKLNNQTIDTLVFATSPGEGARIYKTISS